MKNNDDKKLNREDNIIDFEKEKSTFIHIKKEGKLKKIQEAFKQALPLDNKSKRKTKKKNKP